jgi:hypothetical protein
MGGSSLYRVRRRRTRMRTQALLVLLIAPPTLVASTVAGQEAGRARLSRVTSYVEEYYRRTQSLMVDETVTLDHLNPDLTTAGLSRRLTYELRLEWNPDGPEPRASVMRTLLKVGSREPKPGAKPECLDPKGVSPEPLAFLLADRRERFSFQESGTARTGGREVVLIDFKPALREEPKITGDKECISIDMPMRTRGRIWVDASTDAVVRLEEHIVSLTDVRVPRHLQSTGGWGASITVERSDTETRYQPVRFSDPDETLFLPESVDSLSVIRASGIQRLRVRQAYKNYRRFLTAGRLLP